MDPLQMSDLVALASLAIAAATLALKFIGDTRGNSARDQLMVDKLDRNNEMARETRDTVREMSRKLDDHGQTLVKHTEQIQTLFNRLERVEKNCDLHNIRPEGTD